MQFCWSTIEFIHKISTRKDCRTGRLALVTLFASLGIWGWSGVRVDEEFLVILPLTVSSIQLTVLLADTIEARRLRYHANQSKEVV